MRKCADWCVAPLKNWGLRRLFHASQNSLFLSHHLVVLALVPCLGWASPVVDSSRIHSSELQLCLPCTLIVHCSFHCQSFHHKRPVLLQDHSTQQHSAHFEFSSLSVYHTGTKEPDLLPQEVCFMLTNEIGYVIDCWGSLQVESWPLKGQSYSGRDRRPYLSNPVHLKLICHYDVIRWVKGSFPWLPNQQKISGRSDGSLVFFLAAVWPFSGSFTQWLLTEVPSGMLAGKL